MKRWMGWLGWVGVAWAQPMTPFEQTLLTTSKAWLGRPYQGDALGEGKQGYVSRRPQWRTDAFDCVTWVNTVLAYTLSLQIPGGPSAQRWLQCMTYRSRVSFRQRLHMASADGLPRLKALGVVRPWSELPQAQSLPWRRACITLDRTSWYRHLSPSRVHLPGVDAKTRAQHLAHVRATQSKPQQVCLRYLPASMALRDASLPRVMVFARVRPHWNIASVIGTPLLIAHVGFLWSDDAGRWHMRHASSRWGRVVDVPALPELQRWIQQSPEDGVWLGVPGLPKPGDRAC